MACWPVKSPHALNSTNCSRIMKIYKTSECDFSPSVCVCVCVRACVYKCVWVRLIWDYCCIIGFGHESLPSA